MPFIRLQNIVKDGEDNIIRGSASIIDVAYDRESKKSTKGHSKQTVREKLGLPIWMGGKNRCGIFDSPNRGIVLYDADEDAFGFVDNDDPRIAHVMKNTEPKIHTVFGDGYVFLSFVKNTGMANILRSVFPKDGSDTQFQQCISHLYHTVMRNGDRSGCDLFLEKSAISYITAKVPPWSLKTDSPYFAAMGDDAVKTAFFRAFVNETRKTNPRFGKGCYIDSTPLPNDIDDNPFNALGSHGMNGSAVQMRLVMVLDSDTGLPIWYDIVPGNLLDLNTLKNVTDDVRSTLGLDISEYVLDAGYANKDLIRAYPALDETCKPPNGKTADSVKNGKTDYAEGDGTGLPKTENAAEPEEESAHRSIVVRMPNKRGYPYKTLYHECKNLLNNGKYVFVRNKHTYFGVRKKVKIFDTEIYAYVYVDFDNALRGLRKFIAENGDEFENLTDKDKTWHRYRFGYFALISSIPESPEKMLDRYFGRTEIETVFKTSKEYLNLLPLCKWDDTRIRGKILNDTIALILYLELRKKMSKTPYSVPEIISRSQSLMCFRKDGEIFIEKPRKQLTEILNDLGIPVVNRLSLQDFGNI